MKVLMYLILLSGFFLGCNSITKEKGTLEDVIGADYNNEAKVKSINEDILTSSSAIELSKNIKLYGCDFSIVINDSGDTTYWSTNDTKFLTREGYKVGTSWTELSDDLKKSIQIMPGWGFYIELSSGWSLGFCEGNYCTDDKPTNDSKVKWIFKRDKKNNFEEPETSEMDYSVALHFINEYVIYCNTGNSSMILSEWINNRVDVSDEFKVELDSVIANAYGLNPEHGLDFDPILDAQDYPDEFIIEKVDSNYITVIGMDWPEFRLILKLKFIDTNWVVDGCGVLNLSIDKQVKR